MRILSSILFLSILFSCKNQISDEVEVFENTLGKKYSDVLTDVVQRFEKELVRLYPNSDIKESYKELIGEIVDWNHDDYKPFGRFDTSLIRMQIDRFRDTGFEKELFLKPSYVGMRDGKLTIRRQYINDKHDTILVSDEGVISLDLNTMNLDSFINEEYKVLEYNKHGLYHQALCNINSQDSLIISYLDSKDWGYPGRVLNFRQFQYYNPDFDNYFIKRIFLIEFLY